ncbi:MAG: hypothetical protein ACJ76W_13335 [Chloroflexota bacterium]
MSFARLWATLAILLPALAAMIANLSSVDLAYHLRAGGDILAGGGIPRTDTWTFTASGQPWLDQQWGAQVVLAAVYKLAGWTGLVLLRAALVGLLFGLVFLACRLRGADIRRAAGLALAAFIVSAVALGLRPQLFGMVLLASTLVILAMRRDRPRAMWALPVIVAVWANLHGSFFLGPVVVGLAWLEDRADRDPGARQTLAVGVVAVFASLLNPFGPGVWLYAAGLTTNPEVTARISEWQPTTLRTVPGMLFFASAFAVVVLLARRGARTSWPTLAWLGVFFVIGVYAIRGVAWWPLGAAFAVAPLIARPEPAERPLRAWQRRFHAAIVGAIVVAGIVLLPVWRPTDPDLGAPAGVVGNAPPGITAALREQARAGDHLFNPQPWGSWFEFSFPDLAVGIDSRIEVFPPDVWDDYEHVTSGVDGWQQILERWGVTLIVVPAGDDAFHERLTKAGWSELFADGDGSLLRAP